MNNRIDMGSFEIYLSTRPANQVNIYLLLHENGSVTQNIQSNQCMVVIKNTSNINVQLVIQQAISELQKLNIVPINGEVHVVVMNDNDKLQLQGLVDNDQIKYVIDDVSQQQQNVNQQTIATSNEEKKEEAPFEKFWNANIIYKMDNGILKSYIHRRGDNNNNDYMLEDVSLTDLYEEFKRLIVNKQFSDEIRGLKEEEIANKLLDSIALSRNLKKYYLEGANEIRSDDANAMENTVTGLAASNDGVANKETGIVYDFSNVNSYNSVEQNGDNLTVVTPNVISNNSTVSSGGDSYDVNSNSFEPSNSDIKYDNVQSNSDIKYDNVQLGEGQLQSRKEQNKYVRKRVLKPTPNGFVSIVAYVIVAIFVLFFIGIIIFR